ncbi:hypothetical protein ACROYT_G040776 [Oculina patagonica]
MVYCFAPGCDHHSESHTCKFFGFPNKIKKKEEYHRWIRLIRRKDREPGDHSRICSCHFRDGNKDAGPEIYTRNADKLFPSEGLPPKKKKNRALHRALHRVVYKTWCRRFRPKKRRHVLHKKNLLQAKLFLKPNLMLQRGNLSSKGKLLIIKEHIILQELFPQMLFVWKLDYQQKRFSRLW